jgi:hypothetical protein
MVSVDPRRIDQRRQFSPLARHVPVPAPTPRLAKSDQCYALGHLGTKGPTAED